MKRSHANKEHVGTTATTRSAPTSTCAFLPTAAPDQSFSQGTLLASWNLTGPAQRPSGCADSSSGYKYKQTLDCACEMDRDSASERTSSPKATGELWVDTYAPVRVSDLVHVYTVALVEISYTISTLASVAG